MELRKILKEKILKNNTVNGFADENNIRRASLTDYLNGKKDLTTKVLFRILKPLKMDVNKVLPDKMKKVSEVFDIETDKFLTAGFKYKRKEIESCWKDEKTGATALVLKNKDSKLELHIL